MTRIFVHQTNSQEKSFRISITGKTLTTELIADYGEPKTSRKEFKDAGACQQEAHKLMAKKLSQGYEEIPLHIPGVPVSTLKQVLAAKKGEIDTLEIWQAAESNELIALVCTITTLKKLRLNGIASLPDSIGNLQQLESLEIDESRNLSTLPDSIGKLSQLTTLSIGHTAIEQLPETIGNLSNLRYLTIMGNDQLAALPASIGRLEHLTFLVAFHNREGEGNRPLGVPDTIGQLKHLMKLDLSSNQLNSLPSSIGLLSDLQYLELRNNKGLTTIPPALFELPQLYLLDLEGCGITELSPALAHISTLECIELRGNKISNVPNDIIEEGWEAIRYFLAEA